MSNKMAPDLGKLDELAKVHALSYASPHHFTMSVNGLREVIAELQLPAGNKIALDALTAAKQPLALYNAYGWSDRAGVRAQVDAAIAALQAEPQPSQSWTHEQLQAAFDAEIAGVSSVPYSANEICRWFYESLLRRLSATPPKD